MKVTLLQWSFSVVCIFIPDSSLIYLPSQKQDKQRYVHHFFLPTLSRTSIYTHTHTHTHTHTCIYDMWKCQSLSCVWLFATPWIVACQAPLSMKFSRQGYWRGFLFPTPRDLPNPGIRPASSPLAGRILPLSHQGSPMKYFNWFILINLPSSACKRVTKDFLKSVVSNNSFCAISSVQSFSRYWLFATP